MKANEAPEKIYVDANENWHRTYTTFTEKAKGNDVEYVRKDAFFEKDCEWLKNNVEKYYYLDEAQDKVISTKNLNNDFKKYMED